MGRVIGVFSGKGGVGKTTLVSNLGAALSNEFHKNIVIFDNNIHSSHLGLHLGLYEDLPVTLRDVLKRRVPILQAVFIHPATGIRIIPAPLNGTDLNLTKEKCISLVSQIRKNYDVVIMDCAPGLGKEALVPMQTVDEAVVISTADIASVTDAMKTIELLKKFKKNVLGLVINRYKGEKYELTPQEISSTANYNIIGVIPEDSRIPNSIAKGTPAVISYPHSMASTNFKKLAAFLVNEHYTEENFINRIRNLFNFKFPSLPKKEQAAAPPVQQQIVRKEVSDVKELKEDLNEDVKEELKREIMKKVTERLRGKIRES